MKRQTRILSLLFLMAFIIGPLSGQYEKAKEIRNLNIQKSKETLTIFIEVDKGIVYESFMLLDPNRLVLDFLDMHNNPLKPEIAVGSMGIKKIRTGKLNPTKNRVVFDLDT